MGAHTARAIIFNPESKLLLIERHKNGEHYFVLPGGHVEAGELPEQAVVREVAEETGFKVNVDKLLYTSTDDTYHNDQRLYLCQYFGDEVQKPQLQPESNEAKVVASGESQLWAPGWFSFNELRDKTVYPRGLLKYLEEDRAINYHHNPYKIIERRV
jgi:ADP-ribose pyrophosphatase YjhB (NUDIX family)